MLSRVSRRHAQQRLSGAVVTSFEHLQLPWLCPAVYRCINHDRPFTQATSPLPPRPKPRPLHAFEGVQSRKRNLATAVKGSQYATIEDYIPFEGPAVSDKAVEIPSRNPTLEDLRSNALDFIPFPIHGSDRVPQVQSLGKDAMTGDTKDLLQNLYACVRVGRLDRAAALCRRLAMIYYPTAPELQDAHHQYLTGLLVELLSAPSKDKYVAMQKWFELEMRVKGVPLSGPILAILIKATLAVLDGTRLERTLRRYINDADQAGVEDDTLSSSIFTEAEHNRILRLLPERYEKPHEYISLDSALTTAINDQPGLAAGQRSLAGEIKMPDLIEHTQRGLGLKALRDSLKSMPQGYDSLYDRQIQLERDVIESARERWRQEADITQQMRTRGRLTNPSLGTFVHEWVQEMSALLKEELKFCEAADDGTTQLNQGDVPRMTIAPYLKLMSPEKLSATAILAYISVISGRIRDRELNDSMLTGTVVHGGEKSLTKLVHLVGEAVTQEMRTQEWRDDLIGQWSSLPSSERRQKLARLQRLGPRHTNRLPTPRREAAMMDDQKPEPLEYTTAIKTTIGALFVSMLIKVAKMPVPVVDQTTKAKIGTRLEPILTQQLKWRLGKKLYVVQTHSEFLERLRKEPVGHFIAKALPMLVPPQKWTGIDTTPYLNTPQEAIRFKDKSKSQKRYAVEAAKSGQMAKVFRGLDVIGKVPWRINAPVFQVVLQVWNSEEGIAGFAPVKPEFGPPVQPDAKDYSTQGIYKVKLQRYLNQIQADHSQRCYQNFQLEIAKSFLNDVFYCPHSVDFRGRAYPIPPYFNHMGADHVRGLFLFADGKELGERGLFWLKVHLANMYGYDKQSLSERAQFALDHLSDVYDSAENPMDGRRWWLTSDDPWQTLAACIELKNALDAPDPKKFVSNLPIQQDGTCNGLQHYAALGGDAIGARQVNLEPSDRPADIYSAVADLVKEGVARDVKKGVKYALVVDGYITRKVVKQPVMTNVYGVTAHGARSQVAKQLLDVLPKHVLDSDISIIGTAAYVACLIFEALNTMFNGAQAIQVWLGECGSRISSMVTPEQIQRIQARRAGRKSPEESKIKRATTKEYSRLLAKEDYQFKSTIVWTTPLGLPVVQPYRKASSTRIKTHFQDLWLQTATLSDPVEKRKQLQAFPPNFIHSLDATHMMLSAIACDDRGITFSSVHDSFWTHAGDVDNMNLILRDAFVEMHGEDIVKRLRSEFIARYSGSYRYAPIRLKSVLGQRIQDWRLSQGTATTKFSKSQIETMEPVNELVDEYERVQGLKSDDEEVRAAAKAKRTPCSIINDLVDELGPGVLAEAMLAEADTISSNVPLLGADHGPVEPEDLAVPDVNADLEADSAEEVEMSNAPEEAEDVAENPDDDESSGTKNEAPKLRVRNDEVRSSKKWPRRVKSERIHIWLPLEFPEAPAKGSFDVTKLKESQYFFS